MYGQRVASAGEAAMSAAMINVGLMRESRFPIRNVTAHAYACVSAVEPLGLLQWDRASRVHRSPLSLTSLHYAASFAQPSAAMTRRTD